MFALMCLTVPLALIPYDAEGLPMPIGVTARYGSVRHLMPTGEHPLRFLPGEKTAMSVSANALSVWNLETGLRIREVIEADWEFKNLMISKDGSKIFAVGLATTGYLEKPAEKIEGQPAKLVKTPVKRVELYTYNSTTLERIAKNVLTETKSDFIWFHTNGNLTIPDDTTRQKITLVTIEPTLQIASIAIDYTSTSFFYPSFNESGSRLALANQKELVVYDTATAKELARHPTDAFYVAMSKDGNSVYGVGRRPRENQNSDNPLELFSFNVATKKQNWSQAFTRQISFAYVALNVPLEDIVPVMGEGLQNHDITYYSAHTGKPIPLEPGETYAWRIATIYGQRSADRKRLISSAYGGLSIWDVASRQQILPKKPTFNITQYCRLEFLDGGTTLEVGPNDRNSMGGLKTWDVATGKERLSIPPHRIFEEGGTAIANPYSADRVLKMTARDQSFRVTMVPEHADPTLVGLGIPVLSDPKTGREICRLAGGPSVGNELQLTRNGRYLICHRNHTNTWRWDLRQVDPQPVIICTHTEGANSGYHVQQMVNVSPDQTLAAIILRAEASNQTSEPLKYDVGVYCLDAVRNLRRFKGEGSLTKITWSANGRYLGVTTDKGIYVYDLERDSRICSIENTYIGSINDDGRMIGYANAKKLTFTDTLTGRVRHTVTLSGDSTSVAFAPDRRSVAYVAHDNTVHIMPLFPLSKHVPVTRSEMDAAFPDLASSDAKKAFLAVQLFASDAKLSVPYLRETIPPTQLPADIAATIAKLDSPQFAERDAATKRLTELGSAASKPLKDELKTSDSVEVRTRIEQILATHRTTSPDDLRAHRAHEILDILSTPDALALRSEWAKGEPSILTATAKAKPRSAPFAPSMK